MTAGRSRAPDDVSDEDPEDTDEADEPVTRPDLRLVPAALATWAAVLAGLLGGPAGGIATVLVAASAVITGMVRATVTPRAARLRSGLLAAGGCAVVAGMLITVHASALQANPLHAAAERGAAAEVRVRLTDDPQPLRQNGFGGDTGGATRMLVPVSLVEAVAVDGRWALGGRMVLLTPAEGWAGLLPGQEVSAQGLCSRPRSGPISRSRRCGSAARRPTSRLRRGGRPRPVACATACATRPRGRSRLPRPACCPVSPSATRATRTRRSSRTSGRRA